MMENPRTLLVFAGFLCFASALGPPWHRMDEGSLRSALNAVTRKQRSSDSNPDEYYSDLRSFKLLEGQGRDRDDDLEFTLFENGKLEAIDDGVQKILPNEHWIEKKSKVNPNTKLFDKILLQYLGSDVEQRETVPSAFRERERIGSQKRGGIRAHEAINDKQLAKLFIEELQDYSPPNQIDVDDVEHLDNAHLWYDRQRSEPRSRIQGHDLFNLFNTPMSWSTTIGKPDLTYQDQDLFYMSPAERRNVNGRFPLGREYKEHRELRKRYPVTKRSPNPNQQKRQATDQKVAQDLGKLFGTQSNDHHGHIHDYYDHVHDHDHEHDHDHSHSHEHNHEYTTKAPETTMRPKHEDEAVTQQNKPRKHQIEIKKKSVDWSQYFGIDKRKKKSSLLARAGTQDQDDEWLLQQHYKTMAENLKPSVRVANAETSEKRNMLQQIDSRLKSLEDLIIEEPLRYAGSRDAVEIQKVKDNIMARAAASYSLEKMRRALNEFQHNVAREKQSQQFIVTRNNLTTILPNNESDNKRSGNLIISDEGTTDEGSCPDVELVERRCKAVDIWTGNRAQVFYPLCIMHQICRACVQAEEDNKTCDKLFSSASRACEGHLGCMRAARMAHNILSQLQPLNGTPGLCLCESQAYN